MFAKLLIVSSVLIFPTTSVNAQNFGDFLKGAAQAIQKSQKIEEPQAVQPQTQAVVPPKQSAAPENAVAQAQSAVPQQTPKLAANPNDYPPDLLGKYVVSSNSDPKACDNPSVTIEARQRFNDVDAGCQIVKINLIEGKYAADEKCGREDSKWTQKSTFELGGSQLRIKENSKYQGASLLTLRKCSSTNVVASQTNSLKAITVKCNSNENVIFSGTTGKKDVSICATPSKPPYSKIEYRFGDKEKVELAFEASEKNSKKIFADYETVSPRANATFLWFQNGDTTYAVALCNGGDCKSDGGLLVAKGKKVISKIKLKVDSTYFPEEIISFGDKPKSSTKLIEVLSITSGLSVAELF